MPNSWIKPENFTQSFGIFFYSVPQILTFDLYEVGSSWSDAYQYLFLFSWACSSYIFNLLVYCAIGLVLVTVLAENCKVSGKACAISRPWSSKSLAHISLYLFSADYIGWWPQLPPQSKLRSHIFNTVELMLLVSLAIDKEKRRATFSPPTAKFPMVKLPCQQQKFPSCWSFIFTAWSTLTYTLDDWFSFSILIQTSTFDSFSFKDLILYQFSVTWEASLRAMRMFLTDLLPQGVKLTKGPILHLEIHHLIWDDIPPATVAQLVNEYGNTKPISSWETKDAPDSLLTRRQYTKFANLACKAIKDVSVYGLLHLPFTQCQTCMVIWWLS